MLLRLYDLTDRLLGESAPFDLGTPSVMIEIDRTGLVNHGRLFHDDGTLAMLDAIAMPEVKGSGPAAIAGMTTVEVGIPWPEQWPPRPNP